MVLVKKFWISAHRHESQYWVAVTVLGENLEEGVSFTPP